MVNAQAHKSAGPEWRGAWRSSQVVPQRPEVVYFTSGVASGLGVTATFASFF